MSLTLSQIDKLPQVATSTVRELQWQIDWYTMAYKKAKASTEIAWHAYNEAIDANDAKDEINALYEVAMMFDAIRVDAYRKLDNAKAQYLTMLN